jgi:2-polyprenyl-3-methyl-5-hydroxy-6-metoxy-1,4-benzoquinol methylase
LRPDEASLIGWADAARHRLRGWLPTDKDAAILDMGCGQGRFLSLLEEDGYTKLVGVDLSSEQIELARRRHLNVHLGDARDWLVQHPAHYSLITGFDIIEHLRKEDLLPFLDQVYQSLVPGGRVILQTPNASSPFSGTVTYGDLTHEWFLTSTSLADAYRLTGFEQLEARECAPYFRGSKGLIRSILWQCIRAGIKLWNLAETGSSGSGVYTRVFVASAVRPMED